MVNKPNIFYYDLIGSVNGEGKLPYTPYVNPMALVAK